MTQAPDTGELRVSYALPEVLGRIEGKLDGLAVQLAGKADAATVQAIDGRVQVLERDSASRGAVEAAAAKGRASLWVAVGSLAAAGGTILYVITALHPH